MQIPVFCRSLKKGKFVFPRHVGTQTRGCGQVDHQKSSNLEYFEDQEEIVCMEAFLYVSLRDKSSVALRTAV